MKQRMITMTLEGKTESDLELAFEEVVKLIQAGNTSGRNSNDDGNFSFVVRNEVLKTRPAEVTEEAKHIARQCLRFSGRDIEDEMRNFATHPEGLNMDELEGYVPTDVGSMIQVLIDKLGGVENGGDFKLVRKMTRFFGVTPRFTFLYEGS
ncbi:MAG: hypothetical protein RL358_1295 [Pseudomonadota bacterium]|jgi:hypothetical protein